MHRERPFFAGLVTFMTEGPVVVLVLERENAIKHWRDVMGATNPANAAEGTIRKSFAKNIERNAVHGSDAPETAAVEIPFFFACRNCCSPAAGRMTTVTHLECSVCGKRREAGQLHNLCECGGPLLVLYDLEKAKSTWSRDSMAHGPSSMWRYAPVLPVRDAASIVSLGEGMTPLLETRRLGARFGAQRSVGEGRRHQSHRIVQGSRSLVRSLDVRRAGHP